MKLAVTQTADDLVRIVTSDGSVAAFDLLPKEAAALASDILNVVRIIRARKIVTKKMVPLVIAAH